MQFKRPAARRRAGWHEGRLPRGYTLNGKKHICLSGSAARKSFLKGQAQGTARACPRNQTRRSRDVRPRSMQRSRHPSWLELPREIFPNLACYPLYRPSDGVRVALVRQVSWLAGLSPFCAFPLPVACAGGSPRTVAGAAADEGPRSGSSLSHSLLIPWCCAPFGNRNHFKD